MSRGHALLVTQRGLDLWVGKQKWCKKNVNVNIHYKVVGVNCSAYQLQIYQRYLVMACLWSYWGLGGGTWNHCRVQCLMKWLFLVIR
jgi:hypothetical protein